jgi:hypothetical protein
MAPYHLGVSAESKVGISNCDRGNPEPIPQCRFKATPIYKGSIGTDQSTTCPRQVPAPPSLRYNFDVERYATLCPAVRRATFSGEKHYLR